MTAAGEKPGRSVRVSVRPSVAPPLCVTVLGGGTGSYNVLRGLRPQASLDLRSVVTVMDSGGDSGRLRDEFGVLPPGDVRRCLVALSEEGQLIRELFSFRFSDPPLEGRQFGNLFFLALTRLLGSEREAVEAIGYVRSRREDASRYRAISGQETSATGAG